MKEPAPPQPDPGVDSLVIPSGQPGTDSGGRGDGSGSSTPPPSGTVKGQKGEKGDPAVLEPVLYIII